MYAMNYVTTSELLVNKSKSAYTSKIDCYGKEPFNRMGAKRLNRKHKKEQNDSCAP